jgi:N-acetylmuramoyl-L-alanine amidase
MVRHLLALFALFLVFSSSPALAASADGVPRFGQHGVSTRLVLDLDQEPRYRIDQGDSASQLVVEFREGLQAPSADTGSGEGLIRNFAWQHMDDGRWQFRLNGDRPLRVATVFTIPAEGDAPHRFVIDISADDRKPSVDAPVLAAIGPADAAAILLDQPQAATIGVVPAPKPDTAGLAVPAKPLVVLDAGHGGIDPGAKGVNGLFEKDVNLAVTLLLKQKLEESGRYRVSLTRSDDSFVPLRERVQRARAVTADFFISIHADAHPTDDLRGASVYTLSERASDREAARLADQENRADAVSGIDLAAQSDDVASILIDLAMRETVNDSRDVANILVDEMQERSIRVIKNTHRFAGFAVLKAADVPSVLIELGYLSNPADAKLLNSQDYRLRMATAIIAGLDVYFQRLQQVAAGRP